jgi:glycosyltransferase involved in cell wall biosynthesis
VHICFIEDTHLHGGTQIWVTEAARAFLNRGEAVTVLAPKDSWVVNQCAETGARIVTYDWDEVVHEGQESIQAWTTALEPCDVAICTVHPPRHGFHCSVFAAKVIKAAGLKTHLLPKSGTIVPDYLREFYLPDESIKSSVIAIADFTRRYMVETYKIPEERTTLIYQGTEVDRFTSSEEGRTQAAQVYPLPDSAAPILGSVGSFEHRKGHPFLFNAFQKLVADSLPNAHLMLVGDGPDEEMLRGMAKDMGFDHQVSFFPFTNKPQLVFERIDITVLSSLYKEGLPNVLLESMSMGVPVVSTNLGGVPEVVIDGETGYKATPGDVESLSGAIHKLWADQTAFKRMGENARSMMADNFDKELQFDRFLEYFHSLT